MPGHVKIRDSEGNSLVEQRIYWDTRTRRENPEEYERQKRDIYLRAYYVVTKLHERSFSMMDLDGIIGEREYLGKEATRVARKLFPETLAHLELLIQRLKEKEVIIQIGMRKAPR